MLDFVYSVSGLNVSYRILTKVPADSIPDWDFGDNRGSSNELAPRYQYETSGFYTVTLKIGEDICTKTIAVSEHVKTTLKGSIYNLINRYIPKSLLDTMSTEDKEVYINKWQLYLQPLVNHEVPIEEYSNELYYEALENQLIMELAVYDLIYSSIYNLLLSTGSSLENLITGGNGGEDDGEGRIKQITTGPTEVQFYDSLSESMSSLYKTYTQVTQPGGLLDELKKNICMLAGRLDIYLPICTQVNNPVVPSVSNRRLPHGIDGPNPPVLVNKPGGSLL